MALNGLTVKIIPNDKGTPPGKLAEAELHWSAPDLANLAFLTLGRSVTEQARIREIWTDVHPLEGLKLIGFAIWERKTGNGRNVTFPARQYSVNGERRSFALLRPTGAAGDDIHAQDKVRDLILAAYAAYEEAAATDTTVPPAQLGRR